MQNNSKKDSEADELFDPAKLQLSHRLMLEEEKVYQDLDTHFDVKKGFAEWFEDFDKLEQAELQKRELVKSLMKKIEGPSSLGKM